MRMKVEVALIIALSMLSVIGIAEVVCHRFGF
jgi:hypothetical protein